MTHHLDEVDFRPRCFTKTEIQQWDSSRSPKAAWPFGRETEKGRFYLNRHHHHYQTSNNYTNWPIFLHNSVSVFFLVIYFQLYSYCYLSYRHALVHRMRVPAAHVVIKLPNVKIGWRVRLVLVNRSVKAKKRNKFVWRTCNFNVHKLHTVHVLSKCSIHVVRCTVQYSTVQYSTILLPVVHCVYHSPEWSYCKSNS